MPKKVSILVVDDEDATLQVLQEALMGAGYTVHSARNGAEAWKLLETRAASDVSLLLTDLVMPKMDGMELAKKVSQKYPDVRILFTSGYADDVVYQQKDLAGGPPAFLAKPFTIEMLRRKVKESLER